MGCISDNWKSFLDDGTINHAAQACLFLTCTVRSLGKEQEEGAPRLGLFLILGEDAFAVDLLAAQTCMISIISIPLKRNLPSEPVIAAMRD